MNSVLSNQNEFTSKDTWDGKGRIWTDNPNDLIPINLGNNKYSSMKPVTIMEELENFLINHSSCIHFEVERNGEILHWTYEDYYNCCVNFSSALITYGIPERIGINIIGWNSPEWIISYLGGMFANCISSGVYATNRSETCMHILEVSKCEVVVLDTVNQYEKYTKYPDKSKNVKIILIYSDGIPKRIKDPRLMTFNDFLRIGLRDKEKNLSEIKKRIYCQNPKTPHKI